MNVIMFVRTSTELSNVNHPLNLLVLYRMFFQMHQLRF
jgi:hypothetical protein